MPAIKKCLFPAAGYGTRFLPATKAMPKEMLPIVTKPLIQYGVEEAMDAGITEIGIVTGRGKRAIEDHFDIRYQLLAIRYELEQEIAGSDKEELLNSTRDIMDSCTFSYTRQVEMKGLGRYILSPDIFDVIRSTPPGKNGEMQITDALQIQAQQGKVIGYRFKGRRFDCGSVDGFIEATNYTYKLQSN